MMVCFKLTNKEQRSGSRNAPIFFCLKIWKCNNIVLYLYCLIKTNGMEILREVDGIKLNKGNLMANGLYNLIDENNNVSSWFGEDTKDELISMSDNSFWNYASVLIFDANFPNL